MHSDVCPVDGCGLPRVTKLWCNKHYRRWKKYGSPTAGPTPNGAPMAFLRAAAESNTDECINWPYGKNVGGHARVYYDGKVIPAGRVVLIMAGMPEPRPGMMALHAPIICHNSGCVNPRHLRWGTAAENTADRVADGTAAIREKNPAAKLNKNQVAMIRVDKRVRREISAQFGISPSQIARIQAGVAWT